MNDILEILNETASDNFNDVNLTICKMVKYIKRLEDRIENLEEKMSLIEDRSDLLQSAEERYYN